MKKISLFIIPITLLIFGVFFFASTKDNKAATGDKASYTLSPWTFWQAGVTTDDWNRWELSAFENVEMRDNASEICAYPDSTPNMNPRIYPGTIWFKHPDPATHAQGGEIELDAKGVSHGYVAKIESNGWSGKWIPTDDELAPSDDPPKWGEPVTDPVETTEFVPYLMDNNPYTVRTWVTASNLKKNRTYTWKFDAYIGDDCMYADPTWNMEDHNNQPAPQIQATNKYAKIVGTNETGKILFVRYLDITQQKKTFMFNFDMDSSHSSLKVEIMYGAFLKLGPIIKHKEVVWSGSIYIENCDIFEGNLLAEQETTTARRGSGGGDDSWADEPEKVTGVKAKSKKKKSVILSWSKEENSTKYQINYALKKNFKGGKKKTTSKNKITIKGLKRKKTYYFRVRGKNDDYTGPWSAKKKCKVK
ncbi:MAG: fibronectin type III domain-containing protein [Eubacterium sp.]|nr:fibronectin type III domain-containing protein [Eubacterium sp.]